MARRDRGEGVARPAGRVARAVHVDLAGPAQDVTADIADVGTLGSGKRAIVSPRCRRDRPVAIM